MRENIFDIAIIGAGIAGASLAAAIGDRARVLLIEGESQPGYHATGRSAAFWSESYGGPAVQPLTTASGPMLSALGVLHPRGCLHIADATGAATLDSLRAELAAEGIAHDLLNRAQLELRIPGLRPEFSQGVSEPSCADIDVAALHAAYLAQARRGGARLVCDASVSALCREAGAWRVETHAGSFIATIVVNAAGAWASAIGAMAGASPIAITPYRRTIVQLRTDPPMPDDMPLIMDAAERFYFRPEAGGRLWLSPHDESAAPAHDVAPEDLDVAIAIDRFERAVDWRVVARERAWAGLRSFAPDRAPVYGFDAHAEGFFWCAGQGGFGIQTAPAGAAICAALVLGKGMPGAVGQIDVDRYAPGRFGR